VGNTRYAQEEAPEKDQSLADRWAMRVSQKTESLHKADTITEDSRLDQAFEETYEVG
jgi:hypothetical protein